MRIYLRLLHRALYWQTQLFFWSTQPPIPGTSCSSDILRVKLLYSQALHNLSSFERMALHETR